MRADEMFMKHGVKSISMDDIARDLGISKKTIYQYFSNKEELVVEVSKTYFTREIQSCEGIAHKSENAVDEMMKVVYMSIKSLRDLNPSLIFDIQKYYPKAWEHFEAYKNGYVFDKLRENLRQGIEEGIYRDNINIDIVARMRISQIDASLNPNYFPPDIFHFSEIQIQMMENYILGIATEKGRKLYQQYRDKSFSDQSQNQLIK
ncbi:MAG: TetR/AcrR family transcriptional regulator [Bacteroidetes bacterium]|nr:TetR/AcrR family transcriptional regulator [Bacteroidota bacterium]